MRSSDRNFWKLVAASATFSLGAASFAVALELTAVDYGAKIGAALSQADAATAQQLIAELKSCGVSALISDSGSISIAAIEAGLAGGVLPEASLLLAVNSFVVDQQTVPSIDCAAIPLVSESLSTSNTDSNFPVGSSG